MKWTLEKKGIKEIYEYAKNPRYLKKEDGAQLEESLTKFGQCEPLVINTDGTLIGGHQRLRTLKKMGHKEVDVYIPEKPLTDREVEELNIRLNKNNGSWDFDVLGNAWDVTDLIDWGFNKEDLGLEEDKKEDKDIPKKITMTIQLKDPKHLQDAENRISAILEEYEGSTYKIKVK